VPVGGLVFDVRGVDRDAARLLFRRRVDLVVGLGLAAELGASTDVIAAVSVVLPWSTWPIVPTFTWGLVRSNLPFAIFERSWLKRDPRELMRRGAHGADRTRDLPLTKGVLYH
jgi:hypothetical protein